LIYFLKIKKNTKMNPNTNKQNTDAEAQRRKEKLAQVKKNLQEKGFLKK